jgi:beta-xylosidase
VRAALLVLLLAATAPAQEAPARTYRNPIIDRTGLADPAVIRVDGRYYLYPTGDTKSYEVYISTDLVRWANAGPVFTTPRGGLWAPDVFHHARGDGKFYLYYTDTQEGTPPREDRKQIGVAVADSPRGPFVDRGVLFRDAIDAHLFADDDGSLYLYFCNWDDRGGLAVVPMADPLTPRGRPRTVLRATEPWERHDGPVSEAPWMLKHKDVYYLMYSASSTYVPEYAIGYATATGPLGPFAKYAGNPIARGGGGVLGPGHHSVAPGPDGRPWLVYHQKRTTRKAADRFLAIDPLWFDDAGVLHARLSRGTDQPAP